MIINLNREPSKRQACKTTYTYIGRGSEWGNPYRISDGYSREGAINLYREHLWRQIQRDRAGMISKLIKLEGKQLGCYCAPLACHGEVILKAIKWAKENQ